MDLKLIGIGFLILLVLVFIFGWWDDILDYIYWNNIDYIRTRTNQLDRENAALSAKALKFTMRFLDLEN